MTRWLAGVLLVTLLGGCTRVASVPAPVPEPTAGFPPPRDAPAGEPSEEAGVGAPVPTRFAEVRGLWVVRTTLTREERIRTMVEDAHRAGINTLVVQVRGRGDAYYDSRVEPRAASLAGQPADFDPLALVLREAHARGMTVHGWVNTHLVADMTGLPADRSHMVRAAPDLLAVPRDLARELYDVNPFRPSYVEALLEWTRDHRGEVEGLYSSPANPVVHDRLYRVWMDLVERYPLDGLHFDYIRYPSRDFDYSRGALEAFQRWASVRVQASRAAELDRALRSDPLAWVDGLPELWDRFRRERVTALVERVYRGVKASRPGLLVSAAVFANATDAYRNRFQDWHGWLEQGILDVAAPMAYTPRDDSFRRQVRSAVRAAGDPRRIWAGIGVYRTSYEGTVSKIGIAREVGAGGVMLFSYDWAATEGESRNGVPFLERVGREAFGGGG